MEDYRRRIRESVKCNDDNALEVLCLIAEKTQDCDRITENFKGKLAVFNYIGQSNLRKPHKMKFIILDWFRYKIVDMGIDLKDVTAGAFHLVLKKSDYDNTYDYESLFDEITGWAKREFGIDLIFYAERSAEVDTNAFMFVAGLS